VVARKKEGSACSASVQNHGGDCSYRLVQPTTAPPALVITHTGNDGSAAWAASTSAEDSQLAQPLMPRWRIHALRAQIIAAIGS